MTRENEEISRKFIAKLEMLDGSRMPALQSRIVALALEQVLEEHAKSTGQTPEPALALAALADRNDRLYQNYQGDPFRSPEWRAAVERYRAAHGDFARIGP